MSVRVLTYADPREIAAHPDIASFAGAVHICATESLRKGILNYYGSSLFDPEKVLGIGLLLDRFLRPWTTSATKVAQYASLSAILRKVAFEELNLKSAFRRNQALVLQTMRTLTEIGLQPYDIMPATKEEEWLQQAWMAMESKDPLFSETRNRMMGARGAGKVGPALVDAMRAIPDAAHIPEKLDEVVLHGFYFITPLQQQLFRLMEGAGISLAFLNLYDDRVPTVFRPVEEFIGGEHGWVPLDAWAMDRSGKVTDSGRRFAALYEGEAWREEGDNKGQWPNIKAYWDFGTWLDDYSATVNGQGNEPQYFSSQPDLFNERLKDYFPENYSDRHLLAYPVGQFLFHLHKMWDENAETLAIEERGLFECFASGLLVVDKENAKHYTHVLRDLLPYFSNCHAWSEWKARMESLREAMNVAVEAFDAEDEYSEETRRFHKMMENPLRHFSFFNVSPDNLEIVLAFIEKLFDLAEWLFLDSHGETSLSTHFDKLELLIETEFRDSDLLQEERKILTEIEARVRQDSMIEEQFLVQDLSEAIAVYLGGQLSSDLEKHEIVRRFEDVDAAPLLGRHLHICGLDEESLPNSNSELPWPLTRETVELLADRSALRLAVLREKLAPDIARYLLYSSLAFNESTTLSWIREWNGKQLEQSLYIQLLERDIQEVRRELDISTMVAPETIEGPLEDALVSFQRYPLDSVKEHNLCPRRFYYSYLAQERPVFRDNFHHQFMFGNLTKIGQKMSGRSREEVFQQVSALFPHWTDLQKRDLLEHAEGFHLDMGYEDYEGRDYANARREFQLLVASKDEMHQPANRRSFLESVARDGHFQMTAAPSELCRYCPHLAYCQDGASPVDERE